MLLHSEHGDTFSFNEIKRWLEEAGFKKVRKLAAPGPSPLVLATKAVTPSTQRLLAPAIHENSKRLFSTGAVCLIATLR